VVLVTAHPSGLRQCVVIDGRPCFSRLALRADAAGAGWLAAVREETARLKEYLFENGILVRDKAPLHVVGVSPPGIRGRQRPAWMPGTAFTTCCSPMPSPGRSSCRGPRAESPELSRLLFVHALARGTPPEQLAPAGAAAHRLGGAHGAQARAGGLRRLRRRPALCGGPGRVAMAACRQAERRRRQPPGNSTPTTSAKPPLFPRAN
jgi:hypothetical protein